MRDFTKAVKREEEIAIHGGLVKAPKVLADIIESVAAAIYVDVDLNLRRLWMVCLSFFFPSQKLELSSMLVRRR